MRQCAALLEQKNRNRQSSSIRDGVRNIVKQGTHTKDTKDRMTVSGISINTDWI